jgi:hypothetical protein
MCAGDQTTQLAGEWLPTWHVATSLLLLGLPVPEALHERVVIHHAHACMTGTRDHRSLQSNICQHPLLCMLHGGRCIWCIDILWLDTLQQQGLTCQLEGVCHSLHLDMKASEPQSWSSVSCASEHGS